MAYNTNPPQYQIPPSGQATNSDAPSGTAAPAQAAQSNERPDDIITAEQNGNPATRKTMTRSEWLASPISDPRSGWAAINAQANPSRFPNGATAQTQAQTAPAPNPNAAPAAPAPQGLTAGLGPAYMQTIKAHQASLGRPMTLNDFYALADPANGLGLGAVKEVRAPSEGELPQFGGAPPQAIVEYTSGYKFGISAPLGALTDGGAGVTGEQITGFSYTPPTNKTPLQIQVEIDLGKAQAAEAKARTDQITATNTAGLPAAQVAQANAGVASAQASTREATARAKAVEQGLAAGRTDAEINQILGGTAATLSNAQSNAQQAATGQGRLILDATLGEIDRRYKEGLIDNETRRILSNHAWQRWQADNTNTQTVVAAAGKDLEGDLTQRNQDIVEGDARLQAANSGFSDDTKTVTGLNEWMNPGSDTAFYMLKGLQGMRKAQIVDWGGLQAHDRVQEPGVMTQVGRNTPIAIRSLDTNDDIEQQLADIRAGRAARGTLTQSVAAPTVAPTQVVVPQVRTVPAQAAPAPSVQVVRPTKVPPAITSEQAQDYERRGINPVTGEPIVTTPPVSNDPASQSYIVSNNMLYGSTLQPVTYAQGGTPIAARDLFGRTRPTYDRHAWLR